MKLLGNERHCYGVKPYQRIIGFAERRPISTTVTARAIFSSSSVRMTRTWTRLAFVEISAARLVQFDAEEGTTN